MSEIFSQVLILARESRGCDRRNLARIAGISYAKLTQWEKTPWTVPIEISEDDLEKIAYQLKYPAKFFQQMIQIYPVYFCGIGWV